MSARRSSTLIFGKPSISRVHCPKCKEETLHHFRRCNHCGHEASAVLSWEEKFWSKRRALNVKRRQHSTAPQKMSRREVLNRLKKRLGLLHGEAA